MDNYRPVPGTRIEDLDTPCLLVDLDAVEHNYQAIADTYRDTVCKLRQHVESGPAAQLHPIRHARPLELSLSEIGVKILVLYGDEFAFRGEAARDPDARVPGQRAHLDGQPGLGHRGLDHQEPPDLCIDGDIGKPRRHRLSHNPGEVLVLLPEDLITVPPRELPTIRCHLDHDQEVYGLPPPAGLAPLRLPYAR